MTWRTAATASSARRLVAPITDDGSTALSVETSTKRSTSPSSDARNAASVPPMLV